MTAPRNPSELTRLYEEYRELKQEFKNLKYPKGYREGILRDIRKIERTLEIPIEKWVKV